MLLTLDIHGDDGSGSFTSKARVAPATAKALGATWSSYVQLQYHDLPPAVFRLEIGADVAAGAVHIDHWAAGSRIDAGDANALMASGVQVNAQCIHPSLIRVMQYMELVPAASDQPKLALAFVKSLLRQRIFMDAEGVVALQYDGIDYGRWRFKAYYRGRAPAEGQQQQQQSQYAQELDVGIVNEQTLVLLFPFASSQPADAESHQSQPYNNMLQPIGAHGESFRELVAMALQPSSQSATGRREAGTEEPLSFMNHIAFENQSTSFVTSCLSTLHTVSHSRSLLLHGPSGAGKTTLVQLVAQHFGANLLTVDCSLLLATRHSVQLTELFTAAMRIQPSVLLIEDLELVFPKVLDETKYKLVGKLVGCIDAISYDNWNLVGDLHHLILTHYVLVVVLVLVISRQPGVCERGRRGHRHVSRRAARQSPPALR